MNKLIKKIVALVPFNGLRCYIRKILDKNTKKYNFYKELKRQKEVATFLQDKYLRDIKKWPCQAKLDLKTDKIIWQFWGQGVDKTTPAIVKSCFASVEKYKGSYKHIILTNETVENYITIPPFVYEKLQNNEQFTCTFFSDLLRLYLLSAYGGVWIDATIYLTNSIPAKLLKQCLFMFQRGEKPENYEYWENHNRDYFSWHKDFKVRLLNSFIISKKGNKTICRLKDILTSYWQKENSFVHYFLFQILFNEITKGQKKDRIKSDVPPHIMAKYANEKYSKQLWDEIVTNNSIHKLTYFKEVKKNSILEHILRK